VDEILRVIRHCKACNSSCSPCTFLSVARHILASSYLADTRPRPLQTACKLGTATLSEGINLMQDFPSQSFFHLADADATASRCRLFVEEHRLFCYRLRPERFSAGRMVLAFPLIETSLQGSCVYTLLLASRRRLSP
jgi:hypothetical protein